MRRTSKEDFFEKLDEMALNNVSKAAYDSYQKKKQAEPDFFNFMDAPEDYCNYR